MPIRSCQPDRRGSSSMDEACGQLHAWFVNRTGIESGLLHHPVNLRSRLSRDRNFSATLSGHFWKADVPDRNRRGRRRLTVHQPELRVLVETEGRVPSGTRSRTERPMPHSTPARPSADRAHGRVDRQGRIGLAPAGIDWIDIEFAEVVRSGRRRSCRAPMSAPLPWMRPIPTAGSAPCRGSMGGRHLCWPRRDDVFHPRQTANGCCAGWWRRRGRAALLSISWPISPRRSWCATPIAIPPFPACGPASPGGSPDPMTSTLTFSQVWQTGGVLAVIRWFCRKERSGAGRSGGNHPAMAEDLHPAGLRPAALPTRRISSSSSTAASVSTSTMGQRPMGVARAASSASSGA